MVRAGLMMILAAAVAVCIGCGESTSDSSSDPGDNATPAVPSASPTAERAAQAARRTNRKRAIKRAGRGYYAALSAKDFDSAWNELSPSMKDRLGSYSKWRRGYKYTDSTKIQHISLHNVSYKAAIADVTGPVSRH